ncbi:MAG: hypothetical protein ACYDBJ_24775 [Aggregatilineales bacterium]
MKRERVVNRSRFFVHYDLRYKMLQHLPRYFHISTSQCRPHVVDELVELSVSNPWNVLGFYQHRGQAPDLSHKLPFFRFSLLQTSLNAD